MLFQAIAKPFFVFIAIFLSTFDIGRPKNFFKKRRPEQTVENSTIAHAHFIGNIKQELHAYFLKKQNPSDSKKSQTPSFTYEQSIAHILAICEEHIPMLPQAKIGEKEIIYRTSKAGINLTKETWCWSDGIIILDKENQPLRYEVAFDGKKYFSIYNPNLKCWIMEQGMPIEDYYKYLKAHKKTSFLINCPLFLYGQSCFQNQQAFSGQADLSNYTKKAIAIIQKEEEFKNFYVFYHAYTGTIEFLLCFISEIENYIFLENLFRLRTSLDGFEIFKSIDELYNNPDHPIFTSNGDHDAELIRYLIASNIAFFGNLSCLDECTYDFFRRNQSVAPPPITEQLEKLCKLYGLSFKKYKTKLLYLLAKFFTSNLIKGRLLQIFIHPNKVNDLAIITTAYGYPWDKLAQMSNKEIQSKIGREHFHSSEIKRIIDALHNKNFINKIGSLTTNNILSYFRNNPCDKNIKKIADSIQARIIANPVCLQDPANVKIFFHFNEESDQKYFDQFLKSFQKLIRQMIQDGLKKNTIQKKDGKMPPIANLYKYKKDEVKRNGFLRKNWNRIQQFIQKQIKKQRQTKNK